LGGSFLVDRRGTAWKKEKERGKVYDTIWNIGGAMEMNLIVGVKEIKCT
jgi:hypothetical protein